jgi:hypothetical protein
MKKKLLLVYVFIAFVLLCTNVYAVITMDLSLTANKKEVEPGKEILVTVSLKNPSSAISSIQGYINVDENVVEAVSKDMIVTNENKIEVKSGDTVLDTLTYAYNPSTADADYNVIFNTNKDKIGSDNDCYFVMDFSKDLTVSADILTLKLKVKENASIQDASNVVKLDTIVAYSADPADKTADMSAKLDIKVVEADDTTNDNNNATNENKNTNNTNVNNNTNNTNTNKNTNNTNKANTNTNNTNTNKNTNNTNTNKANTNTNNTNTNKNTNNTNTNTDGTVSGKSIPKAGANLIAIPIIVFAVLAYVSYNKYIKYKDI